MKLLYVLFLFHPLLVHAQVMPQGFGFSSFSGENGVAKNDAFALWNNPAMMVGTSSSVGIAAQNVFAEQGLYHFTASSQITTSFGNIGIGLHRFGDEIANETSASLGVGKALGDQFFVGASMVYTNSFVEQAESKSVLYPQLGMSYNYNQKLTFGFTARNPLSQDFDAPFDQTLQSFYAVGFAYNASDDFSTSLQADIWERDGLGAGLGLEYNVLEQLTLSLGGKTNPGYLTAGLSLQFDRIKAGVGSKQQSPLGLSPQAVFQTSFQ